ADAGVSDDGGTLAGEPAQARTARARARSGLSRRDVAAMDARAAQALGLRASSALSARAAKQRFAIGAQREDAPGVDAPQVRRASGATTLAQDAPARASSPPRASASRRRDAHARVPRAFAVHVDARAAARDRRDPT